MDGDPSNFEVSDDARRFPDAFGDDKPPPMVGLPMSPEEMAEMGAMIAASDNQVSYVENGMLDILLLRILFPWKPLAN